MFPRTVVQGVNGGSMITQKSHQPIELQSAGLDSDVTLSFDGAVPLIESGDQRIAIGPSEQAQINIIAARQIDRLPQQPQLIFTWTPIVSDTRVIDLSDVAARSI